MVGLVHELVISDIESIMVEVFFTSFEWKYENGH